MELINIIKSRRTVRKFRQDKIDPIILREIVDCGRLAPSGRNVQPIEYYIIQRNDLLEPVFNTLRWAGYIAPEGNPQEGEKPTAYITVLIKNEYDSPIAKYDVGAAVENILLAAWSHGIGSCWIASVDRNKLAGILGIPEGYTIDCVIALGYAAETPVTEDITDSVRYYKDAAKTLHVPKRKLDDMVHEDRW